VALNALERKSVAALAAIYATRMLGLFLLLPVLALYARKLPDYSPALLGLTMGAYGLAQVLLQIPFGRWSDRRGRKPLITLGLLVYAAGSLLGALAHSLVALLAARAVQGAGAVSAPVMALLADLTRTQVRTRAMAFIGISIGCRLSPRWCSRRPSIR
jgi:MFS family permease